MTLKYGHMSKTRSLMHGSFISAVLSQILSLCVVCAFLQEFRQRSAEWEQQQMQYQRQVASLEAQRKTLAEQFTQMQVMFKMDKTLTLIMTLHVMTLHVIRYSNTWSNFRSFQFSARMSDIN